MAALGFLALNASEPPARLVDSAMAQIGVTTAYDGRYLRIPYPGGDVPRDRGVCTDVVIRAYRNLNIDLQQRVHDDMRTAWNAYPNPWRMRGPDTNIDHRRVPNLQIFFARMGASLPVSMDAATYRAGDVVSWRLPQGLPHIGIVSGSRTPKGVPLVIHNIGEGTRLEDILFLYRITGHYRYFPAH